MFYKCNSCSWDGVTQRCWGGERCPLCGNKVSFKTEFCTKEFLNEHSDAIFVFGDNLTRTGHGGAAILRDHPQSYGFITKRNPDYKESSFYKPMEYAAVFEMELIKLKNYILAYPYKYFLISKIGGGLANKHLIWECIIKDKLMNFITMYNNVHRIFPI